MGLSKLLENGDSSKKYPAGVDGCMLGESSCMFNVDGNCAAEWCIFSQLPKMLTTTREVTCMICEEEKTELSVLSGQTNYICPKCLEKIKNFIKYEDQYKNPPYEE